MILITMDTEHFTFEACGTTEAEAGDALKKALAYHAEIYGLPDDWSRPYDKRFLKIEPGQCFRDGSLFERG